MLSELKSYNLFSLKVSKLVRVPTTSPSRRMFTGNIQSDASLMLTDQSETSIMLTDQSESSIMLTDQSEAIIMLTDQSDASIILIVQSQGG